MNKPVVIVGTILLILSLIVAVFGVMGNMNHDPGENIIHDTSIDGTFYTDTGDNLLIAVYAKGDLGCTQVHVSIIDINDAEYFESDCLRSRTWSNSQYTYLGDAELIEGDTFEIISNNDIILVSHNNVAFGALGMIGGCCCSFIGLIILIIGLVIGKNKVQQGVMMVQQADGTIQPVGGIPMQQPGGAAPLVGGAVHPAFATEQTGTQPLQQSTTQQSQILPPIGGQQPPNQGF